MTVIEEHSAAVAGQAPVLLMTVMRWCFIHVAF